MFSHLVDQQNTLIQLIQDSDTQLEHFINDNPDINLNIVVRTHQDDFESLTTPLIESCLQASRTGNLDILNFLIAHGAKIHTTELDIELDNFTPLHAICFEPQPFTWKVCKWLLIHGATDIIDFVSHGSTPLSLICSHPENQHNLRTIQTLLKFGASVHISTPFISATSCAGIETMQLILSHHPQIIPLLVNQCNGNETPLIKATWAEDIDKINFLLQHGANPHIKVNRTSAIDVAQESWSHHIKNIFNQ